jgi:hypothetical protein
MYVIALLVLVVGLGAFLFRGEIKAWFDDKDDGDQSGV